jgi:hypothetical protein
MGKAKKWTALLLMLGLLASLLCACVTIPAAPSQSPAQEQLNLLPNEAEAAPAQDELVLLPEDSAAPAVPDEDGSYTTKEDVCAYLVAYGHLPSNFITKDEARAAGWEGGSLEKYCPGKCIGGDRFGNREGLLPSAKGRTWTECDINTLGARSRGAERIVFSNDGLIYYTGDHYESFQLLYGSP